MNNAVENPITSEVDTDAKLELPVEPVNPFCGRIDVSLAVSREEEKPIVHKRVPSPSS